LANMAAMYAIYHGPKNLKTIAEKIHSQASWLQNALSGLGIESLNTSAIFDTVSVKINDTGKLRSLAEKREVNFFYDGNAVRISINENTSNDQLKEIIEIFKEFTGKDHSAKYTHTSIDSLFARESAILTHPVFNSYHSETKMMRYIKSLEDKDLSLTKSMIPLGSCTMKLNAATELMPLSWEYFSSIHPFAPREQAAGYYEMLHTLEKDLANITGFAATSLQPNSGAQGEYAGLMVIRDYQKSIGQGHRNICIIPSSAHGTNPASAVLAGLQVVVSPADENGNINIADLKAKAEEHKDNLCALMVTYPSTHGIFEDSIMEVCKIIHDNGGQVYIGWCQYECSGRINKSRIYRCGCLPFEST
jgi:glycine dehydrogenase